MTSEGSGAGSAGPWSGPVETACFYLVCVAAAAPLIAFPWFVNWDGPSHVGSAYILNHWNGHAGEVFRRYFWLDLIPMPNLTAYGLIAALLRVFPPVWAEKVFVAILVVGFAAGVRYVVTATRRDGAAFSYLALPLAVGWFLHGGQYSFSLGIALGLFVVGAWLRRPVTTRLRTVLLGCALVLLFLTHLVAFGFTLLFLFVLATWDGWSRRSWTQLVHLSVAAVPATVLAMWWELHADPGPGASRLAWSALASALISVKGALAVFSSSEGVIGIAIVGTVAVLSVLVLLRHRRPWRDQSWGLFLVGVAGVILVLAVPNAIGNGGYVTARLSLIPFLAGLGWIAQFSFAHRIRVAVAVIGVVSVASLTVMRLPHYADFNRDFREYLSAGPYLSSGATVLSLVYVNGASTPAGTARADFIDPMQEVSSWFISRQGAVDLAQYEGDFDYFPVQFKESMSPFRHIAKKSFVGVIPPDVDLLSYHDETGGSIDYVITWGFDQAPESVRTSPEATSVQQQLAAAYDLVYTSDRGHLKLYKLRPE